MPNTKSAIKRTKQAEVRRQRNRQVKSRLKTAIKQFLAAVQGEESQEAQRKFIQATKVIDKAAAKGVLHKRTAARKKSRLARILNKQAG